MPSSNLTHTKMASSLAMASPAAFSKPACLPAGPQQHLDAEFDAFATTTTDNSSRVRSKAGPKATRAAPTHSNDRQALQDTAAAAAPCPAGGSAPAQQTAQTLPAEPAARPSNCQEEHVMTPKQLNVWLLETERTVANFNWEMARRGLIW